MEQQIPIQCLYYTLYFFFSVFLFYRRHRHRCFHHHRQRHRHYRAIRISDWKEKCKKQTIAYNFLFLLLLLLLISAFHCVACSHICKKKNFMLSFCFDVSHCKAHSLYYNCHFWLDFIHRENIYVYIYISTRDLTCSIARAITYSTYVQLDASRVW